MRYIIGVDPGKTVGFSVLDRDGTAPPQVSQIPWDEYGENFNAWMGLLKNQAYVACERFVISGGTVRTGRGQDCWPIEVIGITRYLTNAYGGRFSLQDVASAKKLAPNDRLKEIGWHVPGRDHGNDATRHVILALAREFGEPPPWA